jgi:hypothetical protein
MIDRIKFRCNNLFLDPVDPSGAFINMPPVAKLTRIGSKLPFFHNINSHRKHNYETPVWSLRFQFRESRLADIVVVQTETGNLRVAKVDANLPSLLRGHNSTLPLNAGEMHLALTRLDHLLAPLFEPNSRQKFLRVGHSGTCAWSVCSMEVAVQFLDPERQAVRDSHLSQMKRFVEKPSIRPGESTKLFSNELDLQFYAKDLELSKRYPGANHSQTTRFEAHFKTNRAMLRALGAQGKQKTVHTVPYDFLLSMLSRLVKERIVGGLASPVTVSGLKQRGSTRRVVEKAWSPGNLHAALHMECAQIGGSSASRLRERVFDYLACQYPTDLPGLLEQIAAGMPLVELPVEYVQEGFQEACEEYGLPIEPDPEIVAAFSELRLSKAT